MVFPRRLLVSLGATAVAASALLFTASIQAPAVDGTKWDWLQDTYWIVKNDGLPAMVYDVASGTGLPILDQTVYHIERCQYGYLYGRCTSQYGPAQPNCSRVIGNVAPDGSVILHFAVVNNGVATQVTPATGKMARVRGEWTMLNQMVSLASSGTSFVTHWAHMYQVKPTDPEWNNLPFVNMSVPQFLGQCP
jgi:hypothetical protein